MHPLDKDFWKEAFAPDAGTLRDIRVYGTNGSDYEKVLQLFKSRYGARLLKDWIEADEVPDYSTILREQSLATACVTIYVAGVRVNCWFFCEDEISLDILPDEVDSREKANAIFELMVQIANALNKQVLLTPENASADREWSERHAYCVVDPGADHVRYNQVDWP